MSQPVRNRITYRPSTFVENIVGRAAQVARGDTSSGNTVASSGASFAAVADASMTSDASAVQLWTVGIDPLDDTDYVLA